MSSETQPFMSADTACLEEIRSLFNEMNEGQAKIVTLLEELELEEGGESNSSKEIIEKIGQSLALKIDTLKPEADKVVEVNQRSSAKWPFQVLCLTVILMLAVSAFLFSLISIHHLNKAWELKVKENMRTALELEQAVKFFDRQKELKGAGQSD